MDNLLEDNDQCNGTLLGLDEACFHVSSSSDQPLNLWYQYEECDMCNFLPWSVIQPNSTAKLLVSTTFPLQFYFINKGLLYCKTTYRFEEYGQYTWNISGDSCLGVGIINKPLNPYLPIIGAIIILLLTALFWHLGKCLFYSEWLTRIRQRNVPFSELESDLGSPSPTDGPTLVRSELLPAARKQKPRVISLDTFRGLCIAVMIFVNYGGGQYWFFKHSVWNGITIADLVFPWFLWIMGVSLVISLRSQLRSTLRRRHLFLRVLRRSVVLIALGVVLNTYGGNHKKSDIGHLRLPGVLQRLGLSYFFVGSIETLLMKPQGSFQYGRWLVVQDVLDSWLQWLVILGLTATHLLLTFLLPVPGCPKGYLGPGGLHRGLFHGDSLANCTGGAAGYIDRIVFGEQHIYQKPTCKAIYQTEVPYDPEGLLGTLTSVLLVYLGVQAGRVMLCYHYTLSRVYRWAAWATITGLIAGILCNFSKNDGVIPMNKNLWSLSFVLGLASMAFIVQCVLYLLIDAKNWWSGSPFYYAGMNPILLYIGHELTKNMFPWSWKPYYHTHTEYIAMDLWGVILWLVIAYYLFKKSVFLTV